ncbi:MAG TPA: hypothetical protein VIJ40_06885 [Acidimicrobiales bacterium]
MFLWRWRDETGASRMNEVRNEEKKEHSMTESVFPIALRALVEGPASSAQ